MVTSPFKKKEIYDEVSIRPKTICPTTSVTTLNRGFKEPILFNQHYTLYKYLPLLYFTSYRNVWRLNIIFQHLQFSTINPSKFLVPRISLFNVDTLEPIAIGGLEESTLPDLQKSKVKLDLLDSLPKLAFKTILKAKIS